MMVCLCLFIGPFMMRSAASNISSAISLFLSAPSDEAFGDRVGPHEEYAVAVKIDHVKGYVEYPKKSASRAEPVQTVSR